MHKYTVVKVGRYGLTVEVIGEFVTFSEANEAVNTLAASYGLSHPFRIY